MGAAPVCSQSCCREDERFPELRSFQESHGNVLSSACCLSWALGSRCSPSLSMEQIHELHEQIWSCLDFFKAEPIEHSATCGLILGPTKSLDEDMTSADALTRMGQLICRWATSQVPPLQIFVGVDMGWLQAVELPKTGQLSCFGSAQDGARRLCETSIKDGSVHLSFAVRSQLSALRFLPMIIGSSTQTFYLEAFTGVLEDDEESETSTVKDRTMFAQTNALEDASKEVMDFEKFCELLKANHVDLKRFGKGTANTLSQFYETAILEAKCLLKVEDNRLFRLVELVRINLHFRSDEGHQRELRIKSEVTAGGQLRERNQPLAVVLRNDEHGQWEQAVERCLSTKFGLSPAVQKACFNMPKDAYTYQETQGSSETVPGVPTKYKTHTIKMTVKDKNRSELTKIGLPLGGGFTTHVQGVQHWTWAKISNNNEEELMTLLQTYGLSLDQFTWQSFVELYDEVYEKKHSKLEPVDGELVRSVRIIKVWLWANVLNCRHALVLRSKQQHSRMQIMTQLRVLSMRIAEDEPWQVGVTQALQEKLGIHEAMQREGLHISEAAYRQEVEYSRSFPGLKTMYNIEEVHVEVVNPQDQRWNHIGLPAAHDFTFVRQKLSHGEIDTIVARWGWINSSELESEYAVSQFASSSSPSWSDTRIFRRKRKQQTMKEQVKLPPPLRVSGVHELLISRLMEGKSTNWDRAKRCAEQLRSPDYTTQHFHDDITHAFPELRLYCVETEEEMDFSKSVSAGMTSTSAGRSTFEEYQRTIGAMFCIFWLMRLHLDGKECFCFGLNKNWQPKTEEDFQQINGIESQELKAEYKKRKAFYENANWDGLEKLMMGAGILKEGEPHDPDRTLAMLVLMSIHDLMKLDKLRPTCSVKDFNGYKKGEQIGDHDIALSYVLEHFQKALPSFAGLSKSQQDSIRFTHCKMDYNMGWLVQAEAPPGILFGALRKAIRGGMTRKTQAQDVAFYFVHWFADLAGAEPFPMQGCEKFVLKFPLPVLTNFIDSFPVVWNLGPKTETQVYEDYLEWRWNRMDPTLGPVPTDPFTVAKMRLVVMSQGDPMEVLRSFSDLPVRDQETLAEELSLTGCQDQAFSQMMQQRLKGPAILLYYGPALMQKAGSADPYNTMRIIAEIFRTARLLWPLTEDKEWVGKTTILRIDALKELSAQEILDNYCQGKLTYVILRNGEKDGQVKSYSPAKGKPKELDGCVPIELDLVREVFSWRHQATSSFYKALSTIDRSKLPTTYFTTFSKPFMAFVR